MIEAADQVRDRNDAPQVQTAAANCLAMSEKRTPISSPPSGVWYISELARCSFIARPQSRLRSI
jgi:hypothetical protein